MKKGIHTTYTIMSSRVITNDQVSGMLGPCFRCGSEKVGYVDTQHVFTPTCCSCGVDGPCFADPLDMRAWWNSFKSTVK